MNVLQPLSNLLRSLALPPPELGSSFEQATKRTVKLCGWTPTGPGQDRVYCSVWLQRQEFKVCISQEPDCQARIGVLGNVAINDDILPRVRDYFDALNKREKPAYWYSLVQNGASHSHVITWTVPLSRIGADVLKQVIPEMVGFCNKNDRFALDVYRIHRECKAAFGEGSG